MFFPSGDHAGSVSNPSAEASSDIVPPVRGAAVEYRCGSAWWIGRSGNRPKESQTGLKLRKQPNDISPFEALRHDSHVADCQCAGQQTGIVRQTYKEMIGCQERGRMLR